MRHTLLFAPAIVCALAVTIGCSGGEGVGPIFSPTAPSPTPAPQPQPQPPAPQPQPQPQPPAASLPSFLTTGWIWAIAPNVVRTMDFRVVNGVGTAEVRAWQQVGSLGWQSTQSSSNNIWVSDGRAIAIQRGSGAIERYQILGYTGVQLRVQSLDDGGVYDWFNCQAPSMWPSLVRSSVRACY